MNNLFIYIPTYNRPVSLQRQLSVLLPQVKKYPDNVRVLVCDNNSEDYEEKDILKNHPHLKNVEVRRNVGNIHGNANISLGFVFARANEFLWILSDDDLITNDAVQEVLSRLDDNIDMLFFSTSDSISKKVINWTIDDLLLPIKLGSGLISNTVYRIESVKYSIYEAFYYHNSSFPHLAVQLSAWKKREFVNLEIIPNNLIFDKHLSPPREKKGDYSLSNVAMPLLTPLLNKKYSKIFINDWIKKHGLMFYAKKHMYPHLFFQSKSIIQMYGTPKALLYLFIHRILYIPYTYLIKNNIDLKKYIILYNKIFIKQKLN